MSGKPLHWLGSSRTDIRGFPRDARRIAGVELRRVQQGLGPLDWKPMTSVGPGVREIRVHTGLEHRVVYVAKFAKAIYVLHAFEKRARKTPARHVDLARQRFRALLRQRRLGDPSGGLG